MTGDAASTLAVADLLMKAGAAGSLVVVLIIGYKRYWVYGPQLKEAEQHAEQRIADIRESEQRLRYELVRQIEWWQARDVEQRAVTREALLLSADLREAIAQARDRSEGVA